MFSILMVNRMGLGRCRGFKLAHNLVLLQGHMGFELVRTVPKTLDIVVCSPEMSFNSKTPAATGSMKV